MTDNEFTIKCRKVLGPNFIDWSNDKLNMGEIHLCCHKVPTIAQAGVLKNHLPMGCFITWHWDDKPIIIDTN